MSSNIVVPEEVTNETEDGPQGFWTAFFGDEAYLNFDLDAGGSPRVLDIMASESVRGRAMLDWLIRDHGIPAAVDVVPSSVQYWEKMLAEGRVTGYQTVSCGLSLSI